MAKVKTRVWKVGKVSPVEQRAGGLDAAHAWRMQNTFRFDVDVPAGTCTALLQNESDVLRLMIAGVVSDVRASSEFVAALRDDPEADVDLEINSPGGSFDQGMQLFNALAEHRGNTVARITGMAASTAFTIACGCDTIKANENAQVMIHPAHTVGLLEFRGLDQTGKDTADFLQEMADKGTDQLIDLLANRSGQTSDECKKLVTARSGNGTAMTAREAHDLGFVDEIIEDTPHTQNHVQFQNWLEEERVAIESVTIELQ